MTVVSVLYPQTATSRFDYGYYLQTHIPLVTSLWMPLGLQKIELLRGNASLDGGGPAFAMVGALYFESDDAVEKAVEAHGAEVLGDIPNFTDVEPIIQRSEAA